MSEQVQPDRPEGELFDAANDVRRAVDMAEDTGVPKLHTTEDTSTKITAYTGVDSTEADILEHGMVRNDRMSPRAVGLSSYARTVKNNNTGTVIGVHGARGEREHEIAAKAKLATGEYQTPRVTINVDQFAEKFGDDHVRVVRPDGKGGQYVGRIGSEKNPDRTNRATSVVLRKGAGEIGQATISRAVRNAEKLKDRQQQ